MDHLPLQIGTADEREAFPAEPKVYQYRQEPTSAIGVKQDGTSNKMACSRRQVLTASWQGNLGAEAVEGFVFSAILFRMDLKVK